jgi:hypothetical protein
MKQVMSEMFLNNIERSYVYGDKGRVSARLFRAGDVREETTTSYNEHGDVAETVRIERCIRPHNPRLAHLDRLPLRDSLLLSIRQSRQLDRANNGRCAAILRDSPQAYILLSATGANEARFCPPQRRVNGRVIQILYNNLAVNLEGEPWGT